MSDQKSRPCLPSCENDPVSIEAALLDGRAAWARLRGERKSWRDWVRVARALAIGRTAVMEAVKTNRPVGSKYNSAMRAWLRDNGLDGISTQERYRALLVLENLAAIEAWRDALPEATARRLNHPGAVWHAWRRSGSKQSKPVATEHPLAPSIAAAAERSRRGKAVYWSQDALARAHVAMLRSRSTDLLVLARLALQGAIRDEADLLKLLSPERLTTSPIPETAIPAHAAA